MQDIEETRINLFRKANQTAKDLYGSMELADAIEKIEKSLNLVPETKRNLVDVVGDTILGIYRVAEFKQKLIEKTKLSEESAVMVVDTLRPFLDAVSSYSVPQANNQLKEKLELRPEGVARPSTPLPPVAPQGEGALKPLTRDEVLKALSPQRTMKSDIEAMRVDDGK